MNTKITMFVNNIIHILSVPVPSKPIRRLWSMVKHIQEITKEL